MAANLQRRGIASLYKSLQSCGGGTITPYAAFFPARAVHVSMYDKNMEEHVQHPTTVPDEVIRTPECSNYWWAPHPETGVFGPSTDHNNRVAAAGGDIHPGADQSVLELKAFFRPLEDLEKPPYSGF
ncbi:unnamed protein product [Cuscuta epithymum]|uniref:Uncharacterized protein n=1 Tax=Cuscuta epithymum TaxID=186058 RepID=A0AAV0G0I3_9ASTE|nr:unnamed protein product [Cuscuta epithymum]